MVNFSLRKYCKYKNYVIWKYQAKICYKYPPQSTLLNQLLKRIIKEKWTK